MTQRCWCLVSRDDDEARGGKFGFAAVAETLCWGMSRLLTACCFCNHQYCSLCSVSKLRCNSEEDGEAEGD